MTRIKMMVAIALVGLGLSCGDDSENGMSVGNGSCPAMSVVDDGSGIPAGGVPDLIISEVSPDAFIELYNTTGADIALVNSPYYLCSPFDYAALATLGKDVVVPAGGYATVPYPDEFTDTIARGEVILFMNSNFFDPAAILDFVCWGMGTRGSRFDQAVTAGKWSGDCAAALLAGSTHRLTNTSGTGASSYNSTAAPTPDNCTP